MSRALYEGNAMEFISQTGMVLLFVFTVMFMLVSCYLLRQLILGLKPNCKYIAPLFGPLALAIPSFYYPETKHYIIKFWVSVIILAAFGLSAMQFGKSCFPNGISAYECQQRI